MKDVFSVNRRFALLEMDVQSVKFFFFSIRKMYDSSNGMVMTQICAFEKCISLNLSYT